MSKDQGPKAARRFTKRFARPGYAERQGYLATPFTRDDMVAILRDIYRGWRVKVATGDDGLVTFTARWPISPLGAIRAIWALCWHVGPRQFATDLLWRNGTREVDFTKRTLHTFVF